MRNIFEARYAGRAREAHANKIKTVLFTIIKSAVVAKELKFHGDYETEIDLIDYNLAGTNVRFVHLEITRGQPGEYGVGAEYREAYNRADSVLSLDIIVPNGISNRFLNVLGVELSDVLRHELEHADQTDEELAASDKTEEDKFGSVQDMGNYYMSHVETQANISGFMSKAKQRRAPFSDILGDELGAIADTMISHHGFEEEEVHELMNRVYNHYVSAAIARYGPVQ
jgi:hypothetical protein